MYNFSRDRKKAVEHFKKINGFTMLIRDKGSPGVSNLDFYLLHKANRKKDQAIGLRSSFLIPVISIGAGSIIIISYRNVIEKFSPSNFMI